MLSIERRNLILHKLQEEKKVVVGELSATFGVSEETIRRDLEKLEKEGHATKTYGGAVLKESTNTELPFVVRKNTNVLAKQKIAELLANLINDGDHLMLDASSTALAVAKRIKNKKDVTVITNSIEILIELSEVSGWKILSTGGSLREGSLAFVGPQAEKMLESFHVDKAIISCKGVDEIRGITDSSDTHAAIKSRMLYSADKRILAIDSTKYDKVSFAKLGDVSEINMVVTDVKPDDKWSKIFEANSIEVVYPQGETL